MHKQKTLLFDYHSFALVHSVSLKVKTHVENG